MRLLLTLLHLVFIVCAARGNIIALPIDDNLGLLRNQNSAEEQMNLQMFSGVKELPFGYMDPGKHLYKEMEERSLKNHIPARSRSPCRSFFWKTFSTC